MARHLRLIEEFPELVFPICDKFVAGEGANDIAEWVQGVIRQRGAGDRIIFSREQVYPVLTEARRLGYIRLCPPVDKALAQRVADTNGVFVDKIRVVAVQREEQESAESMATVASERTTAFAGDWAVELIREIGRKKNRGPVHIGIGSGRTTMLVARRLAYRLRSEYELRKDVSRLVIHAISSGFRHDDPFSSPVAFFSYFTESSVPVSFVGLFSEAVVPCDQFDKVTKREGVRESFEQAKDIDLVISSLSGADNPDGLLNRFIPEGSPQFKRLKKAGWVGDCQFRPYSATAPILETKGVRAVTLFEIDDYVRRVRDGKYFLLCVTPHRDGVLRSNALRPLLPPNMRVWSHLVMDRLTALDIVPNSQGS